VEELLKEIKRQRETNTSKSFKPAVSLELFFNGNNDPGCIGANLPDDERPGLYGFYSVLKSIRERPDVIDVLILIHDTEGVGDGSWPFSEDVVILTSANKDELQEPLSKLCFSEIHNDQDLD
jgi:hypothetical protein